MRGGKLGAHVVQLRAGRRSRSARLLHALSQWWAQLFEETSNDRGPLWLLALACSCDDLFYVCPELLEDKEKERL